MALVLSQLGKSKALARRRYRQFVLEKRNEAHQEKYYKVKDQRYLGEDEFIEKVEKLKKSQEPVHWDIPIEEIARKVMDRMEIPPQRLYSMSRDRRGAYGRGLVGYLGRKLAGFRVKEVAQHFKREPMMMSLGIRKIENLLQMDKELAQRVEAMEVDLIKGMKKKCYYNCLTPISIRAIINGNIDSTRKRDN